MRTAESTSARARQKMTGDGNRKFLLKSRALAINDTAESHFDDTSPSRDKPVSCSPFAPGWWHLELGLKCHTFPFPWLTFALFQVTLRFKFPWQSGYWSLFSVEYVGIDAKQYNLTLASPITAPRYFSYHCGGELVFRDAENGVELSVYDIQAQPDSRRHRFGSAYDCVPFTTAPIWSGIFTVFVLLLGLTVGLVMLGSIKTMDKFDNHKTKQLTITVWE